MTILTKSTDKKKLLAIPSAPSASLDGEAATTHEVRNRTRAATWLVFLLAILVLLVGVLAGVCFYRQFLREKIHRLRMNCFIPYSDDVNREENFWVNAHWRDADPMEMNKVDGDEINDEEAEDLRSILKQMLEKFQHDFNEPMKEIQTMESEISALDSDTIHNKWFKEELELKDDSEDSYADITIPDFKEGRSGRFIHDYKNNQTTIIDDISNRCFVYPLDYETTLPPQSMADVFLKMQSGYYFPDTTVLRKKMRVVLPELERSNDYISKKTLSSCENMKIYRLESFVSGVYKRSISDKLDRQATFANFAGKGIIETDLMNMGEVVAYEKNQ